MLSIDSYVQQFRRQLRSLKFTHDVKFSDIIEGNSAAFVKFYRHLLCDHNADLTRRLVDEGFDVLGTTDYRLMEILYRIIRDVLHVRPPITLTQFYSTGFVERKLEMAIMVSSQIAEMLRALSRRHQPIQIVSPPYRRLRSYGLSHLAKKSPVLCPGGLVNRLQFQAGARQTMSHTSSRRLLSRTSSPHSEPFSDKQLRSFKAELPNPISNNVVSTSDQPVDGANSNSKRPQSAAGYYIDSGISEQQNQCSTFHASIPNVAQLDQLNQKSQKPAFQGRLCRQNSKPRTTPSDNLRGAILNRSKLPPSRPGPTGRALSSRVAFGSRSAGGTSARGSCAAVTSDSLSPNVVRNIVESLAWLSRKVDSMLVRMMQLESRLPINGSSSIREPFDLQNLSSELGPALNRKHHEQTLSVKETVTQERLENSMRSLAIDHPFPRTSAEIQLPSPKPPATLFASGPPEIHDSSLLKSCRATNAPRQLNTTNSIPSATVTSVLPIHCQSNDAIESNISGNHAIYEENHFNVYNRNRCSSPMPSRRPAGNVDSDDPTVAQHTNAVCPTQFDPIYSEKGDASVGSSSKLPASDQTAWPPSSLGSSTAYNQLPPSFSPTRAAAPRRGRWRPVDSFLGYPSSNNNSKPKDEMGSLQSYHSQVDRITMMLTETQGLLNTARSSLVSNGVA